MLTVFEITDENVSLELRNVAKPFSIKDGFLRIPYGCVLPPTIWNYLELR